MIGRQVRTHFLTPTQLEVSPLSDMYIFQKMLVSILEIKSLHS